MKEDLDMFTVGLWKMKLKLQLNCYKGIIKRDREFIAEVEMLSRLHHHNLVKLIGICIKGRTRWLVYELVRNGSVESHLHGILSALPFILFCL